MPGATLAYGIGRVAFGLTVFLFPARTARAFAGVDDRHTTAAIRSYGTRDLVLGAGVLTSLARRRDATPFVAAGIAADVLDVVAQLSDWRHLPPRRRTAGVALAVGSAAVGALVSRSR